MRLANIITTLLYAFIIIGSAAAQNDTEYEYSGTLTDHLGKPLNNVGIYTKAATTDEEGKITIRGKRGRGILIMADGYQPISTGFRCDQTIRLALSSDDRYAIAKLPKSLDLDFTSPIYIVNGKYSPQFKASNYTDDQIKSVTVEKKLDKAMSEQLKDVVDFKYIKRRGVVNITLNDDVNLVNIGQTVDYTIIVTGKDGAPLVGATLYLKKGKSDEDGYFNFNELPEKQAVAYKSRQYSVAKFDLNTTENITLILNKISPNNNHRDVTLASFQNQGINTFGSWIYSHLNMALASELLSASESPLSAKVTFYIDRNGVVDYVRIIECNNKAWANHIKDVIYKSPRWTPCKINSSGKAVSCKYNLPITLQR